MNGIGGAGGGPTLDGQILEAVQATKSRKSAKKSSAAGLPHSQSAQVKRGQGAQFIYTAATVANILCDNLTEDQVNLLANFLSVVTACAYAILTVENPSDIIEA